jgi:hypothetical protein
LNNSLIINNRNRKLLIIEVHLLNQRYCKRI